MPADRPTLTPAQEMALAVIAEHGPMPFGDVWKHIFRFSWRTGRIVERAGLIRAWDEGEFPAAKRMLDATDAGRRWLAEHGHGG